MVVQHKGKKHEGEAEMGVDSLLLIKEFQLLVSGHYLKNEQGKESSS
jgi:hypothetical protein